MSGKGGIAFPAELTFGVYPKRLKQAVDGLPEVKGRQKKRRSQLDDLQGKLLSVDVSTLSQWKMKANVLEMLTQLAAGQHDLELRKRIVAISIASMANFHDETLQRLIPLLMEEKEFTMAVNARFARQNPTNKGWLAKFYPIFRKEHPPQFLAQIAIEKKVHLLDLSDFLQMSLHNPLYQATCVAFSERWNFELLQSSNFDQVRHFCASGNPLVVRQMVLMWLLQRYCHQSFAIQQLYDVDVHSFFESARKLLNAKHRQALPPFLQKHLQAMDIEHRLRRWLGDGDRYLWWRNWLHCVDTVLCHHPSGIVCIYANNFVAVERFANPKQLELYGRQLWSKEIQAKLWQSQPFNITVEAVILERELYWQQALDDWMRDMNQGEPLTWEIG